MVVVDKWSLVAGGRLGEVVAHGGSTVLGVFLAGKRRVHVLIFSSIG